MALWNYFADISAVPRPSLQEHKAAAYIMDFGKKQNLETIQDRAGNVLLRKPATLGMENKVPVALQAHLDMVHQQSAATVFDFQTQGIEAYVAGDWVKACGTTLGADNGIGVAAILAVLASNDISHPRLEALFTVGEEVGAMGALGLESHFLQADILLNLDAEDDRQLIIGCAGSLDITAKGSYVPETGEPTDLQGGRLVIKGLTGGHSGVDIHFGRGNAIKILGDVLATVSQTLPLFVSAMEGGNQRNAIPREATAVLAVPAADRQLLKTLLQDQLQRIKAAFVATDPALDMYWEPTTRPASFLPADFQKKLLQAIVDCPHGVSALSPVMEGMVQTSNNLSQVLVKEGHFRFHCLTRSFSETEKMDLGIKVQQVWAPLGADVALEAATPGWQADPGSGLVKRVSHVYRQTQGGAPDVRAIHAGLECGIIGSKYPRMEMISFGPTIRDAHSPNERVQISSVRKFWGLLRHILKEVPGENGVV